MSYSQGMCHVWWPAAVSTCGLCLVYFVCVSYICKLAQLSALLEADFELQLYLWELKLNSWYQCHILPTQPCL